MLEYITAQEMHGLPGQGFKLHHIASARGYISRTESRFPIENYSGKFGDGIKVHCPRWDTTNYHYVYYYIRETGEK